MRLDGRIKGELRQSGRLSQTVQQALHLVSLGPADLLGALTAEADANPFLRLQPPQWASAAGSAPPGPPMAEPAAQAPGLIEHVLRQLDGLVASREDRRLARALIEDLDATGYLAESPSQIARRCGVPPERLEAVLQQMQRAEPAGLFARDLADCLSLQLDSQGALTPEFRRLLARLPLIVTGEKQDLAQQCGVSLARLAQMLAQLRRLDPRPGAAFGWQHAPSQIPELLILRLQTGWDVQLNPEAQPGLVLDQEFRAGLGSRLSPGLAAAWGRAQHLAKALDLRNRSVLAVGRCIVARQSTAIAGNPSDQSPLTRRMVATELGLHETTVGRIVRHASARIEGRTVALSQFFGRSTTTGALASGVSQQRLLSLISTCVAQHAQPGRLTDKSITAWLAERDIIVARRTVAKYRHKLKPHCGSDPTARPAAESGDSRAGDR